jgi:hypothetical protein
LPLEVSSSAEAPAMAVLTYIGLSWWPWLRWRKLLR